jgi:hypothetical protein
VGARLLETLLPRFEEQPAPDEDVAKAPGRGGNSLAAGWGGDEQERAFNRLVILTYCGISCTKNGERLARHVEIFESGSR